MEKVVVQRKSANNIPKFNEFFEIKLETNNINSFFQKIISAVVKYRLKKNNKRASKKQLSNEVEILKIDINHIIKDAVFS